MWTSAVREGGTQGVEGSDSETRVSEAKLRSKVCLGGGQRPALLGGRLLGRLLEASVPLGWQVPPCLLPKQTSGLALVAQEILSGPGSSTSHAHA